MKLLLPVNQILRWCVLLVLVLIPSQTVPATGADSPVFLPLVANEICPVVPALLSPPDGSHLETLIPLFQWDSGNYPNANSVFIQISKDHATVGWRTIFSGTGQGPGEFKDYYNLEPATNYFWRAYVNCEFSSYEPIRGPYSEVWSFRTGSDGKILAGPKLLAPENESTIFCGTSVTLQWDDVIGADEYVVRFQQTGFRDPGSYYVQDEQITFSLTLNTHYKWWVFAVNEYAIGAESAQWLFSTTCTYPEP